MLFKSVFTGLALGAQLSAAALAPDYRLAKRNGTAPTNWGVIAMPGASMLDIYGPLEMLYIVAANYYFNLTIITPNGENVVVKPPMGNPHNSTFSPEYVGSASFEDELDLDVLMVPGGAAARDPALTYVDDYLVKMKPQVDYLITICTGAIFAARGGLFDGRRVTTNKNAWSLVTAHGENVTWVAPARYVIDGDIWSSSGVTAGIDLTLEWIKQWYGEDLAKRIAIMSEVVPRAHDDDPFTDMLGIPHQGQL